MQHSPVTFFGTRAHLALGAALRGIRLPFSSLQCVTHHPWRKGWFEMPQLRKRLNGISSWVECQIFQVSYPRTEHFPALRFQLCTHFFKALGEICIPLSKFISNKYLKLLQLFGNGRLYLLVIYCFVRVYIWLWVRILEKSSVFLHRGW